MSTVGTQIVQAGVEVSPVEVLDAIVFAGNMSIAQVLAKNRSVLAFCQRVIRAAAG
jgi:hypothetical protein